MGLRYFAKGGDDLVARRVHYFGGEGALGQYLRTGRMPRGWDANGTTFGEYVGRTGVADRPSDVDQFMREREAPSEAGEFMRSRYSGGRVISSVSEDADFSGEADSIPAINLDEKPAAPYVFEGGKPVDIRRGDPLDPARKYQVTIPVRPDDTPESLLLKGLYRTALVAGMDKSQAYAAALDLYKYSPRAAMAARTNSPISQEDLERYKKAGSTTFNFENPEQAKILNWYIERGLTGPGQGMTPDEMRQSRELRREVEKMPAIMQGYVKGLGHVNRTMGNALSVTAWTTPKADSPATRRLANRSQTR